MSGGEKEAANLGILGLIPVTNPTVGNTLGPSSATPRAASDPCLDLSYGVVSPAAVDLACARKLTTGTVSK